MHPQEGVCYDRELISRVYCGEQNYLSFGRGWVLLSTAQSGTENRLYDW